MAYLTLSMYSNVLAMDTDVSILLPEARRAAENFKKTEDYPVLYCLHGHGDDHTAWIRKSNIELLTRKLKAVVVMPTVQRGYYVDSPVGLKYYTYLVEELPEKLHKWFHISLERKDNFIMGNSMGGYGALRIALANPGKYAGVAALSPALPQTLYDYEEEFSRVMALSVGNREDYEKSDNNILNLIDRLEQSGEKMPQIYVCCGNEDPISLEGFRLLKDYVGKKSVKNVFRFYEGEGRHDWDFWNPQIRKAVEMFAFEEYK